MAPIDYSRDDPIQYARISGCVLRCGQAGETDLMSLSGPISITNSVLRQVSSEWDRLCGPWVPHSWTFLLGESGKETPLTDHAYEAREGLEVATRVLRVCMFGTTS